MTNSIGRPHYLIFFASLIVQAAFVSQSRAASVCSLVVKPKGAYVARQELISKYILSEPVAPKVMKVEPGTKSRYDVENVDFDFKPTDRFNIEKIMKDFELSRFQAVEVQALLRRFTKSPNDQQFKDAIEAVRKGETLSRLNLEKIKKAKFTLVMDIDGTLLDQDAHRYVPEVHQSSFLVDGKELHHVALNPGAVKLIQTARELGGAVVLYSRNNDLLIWEILNDVKVGNKRLSTMVDGVLTSSHMVVPPHLMEKLGMAELSAILKKDLRIIPSERTIIIDDDPSYILQTELSIGTSKFEISDVFDKWFPKKSSKKKEEYEDEFEDKYEEKKDSDKLSSKEKKRLAELLKAHEDEYANVGETVKFLASDLSTFTQRQIVFSPRGSLALELLTGNHKKFELPGQKEMAFDEAFDHLLDDPSRVEGTIKKAKRKKEKEREFRERWLPEG